MNKEGKGPAWANSLFEDNAEHGLGMYLGQKKIRDDLKAKVEEMIAAPSCCQEIKDAAAKWLETYDDGNLNQQPTKDFIKALEENISAIDDCIAFLGSDMGKQIYGEAQPAALAAAEEAKAAGRKHCTCKACDLAAQILAKKDYLNKKSMWIFGGDGWAYDIGYGGVDHVLASGEDVNVFVFNTEVYSNTGGQASKASNIGQVAQFAAAGKELKSKSLAEMAMTYGYVYVAQIAMGGNKAKALKAIVEAEAHKGPSLIIAYAPCEMHSIGRHDQLPEGNEQGCGLRLLEPVPLQSRGREALHAGQQGACRRLPGVPHERGPLQPSDPRVPGPCRPPVQGQRGQRQGPLRAPDEAEGPLRVSRTPKTQATEKNSPREKSRGLFSMNNEK